jgi:alpha-glucosidase
LTEQGGREWWRQAVFYQIYPRSFQDSNGDGVGDLPGIISRLDYLAGLGIDALWISPFYRSPMADFGYDVADYCDVDPVFGTLADFDRLLAAAHERGIRVTIDFVPNHSSDQHPWFLDSRSGRASAQRDWYVWADPKPDGSPPNNWASTFARFGPAWTFDQRTGQYYLHSFAPQQPDLNWWNPKVREAMDGVLRFWLDRGVDGFRIDVAHMMARDPELRDTPVLLEGVERPAMADWPGVHDILRSFRRTIDSYPDRMAVGEVWLSDMPAIARYYGESADELHMAFNFFFFFQPWHASAFRACVDGFEAALEPAAWPDYTLSNHDQSRPASRYDDGGLGQERARLAAMMLLTLRGTPFLYYGEELGMTDGSIPAALARDPDGRDPYRTPMQWDASPHAGFTTGTPWLPVSPSFRTANVARELADAGSLLNLYRRLLRFRRTSEALRLGSYTPIDAGDGVFAYLRQAGAERLLVLLNFENEPRRLSLAQLTPGAELVISTRERPARLEPLVLGANEGIVVRI